MPGKMVLNKTIAVLKDTVVGLLQTADERDGFMSILKGANKEKDLMINDLMYDIVALKKQLGKLQATNKRVYALYEREKEMRILGK